jgi:hypothetical protein
LQRSQAIDDSILLPDSIDDDALLQALLSALARVEPDIVVPTDDATILLLHSVVALAERGRVDERTRAVLRRSSGKFEHLRTARDRKLLAALASSVGARTPEHAVVRSEADALAFAARQGYPVVLKEEDSVAGFGVSICEDERALRAAVAKSSQNEAVFSQGLLAQSFVAGKTAMRVVVAQAGRVLGGLSAIKLETWPRSTGPSTCLEFIDHAEMDASAQKVIGALGYSGFASLDFMLDAEGRAFVIELNPRPTPITHLGERFGACLCRKLHAALTGEPTNAGEPQGLPSRVALFPQEWVRDQNSPHLLAGVYHDAPWDEPDLVEAYVAFGRAQMRFEGYRALYHRNEDLRRRLAALEGAEAGT